MRLRITQKCPSCTGGVQTLGWDTTGAHTCKCPYCGGTGRQEIVVVKPHWLNVEVIEKEGGAE